MTQATGKPRILFVYDMEPWLVSMWDDGLYEALRLLEMVFDIDRHNLLDGTNPPLPKYDFVLGWGAFNSPVDNFLQKSPYKKKGLCVGGNARDPIGMEKYDVLFYETDWYLPQIMAHRNPIHAFGVNTSIFKPIEDAVPIWDWLTIGAFAIWKRQDKLLDKGGYKMAVGQMQRGNILESMQIVSKLISNGVCVSDSVFPDTLAKIYNSSAKVYIPADVYGGGERAVLEARACGRPVEVEFDNPKLKELLKSPVWDEHYYADQLRKGIEAQL